MNNSAASAAHGFMRWLPGVAMLTEYRLGWLHHDIVAGVVLITMLVPVGIAYATASGVPGVYGLYATIIPLLAYAVFGPSRILVLGPDSSLARSPKHRQMPPVQVPASQRPVSRQSGD
jgi:MFS superfamily sulfate permease-like transporter